MALAGFVGCSYQSASEQGYTGDLEDSSPALRRQKPDQRHYGPDRVRRAVEQHADVDVPLPPDLTLRTEVLGHVQASLPSKPHKSRAGLRFLRSGSLIVSPIG